jgi:hypothetical protein
LLLDLSHERIAQGRIEDDNREGGALARVNGGAGETRAQTEEFALAEASAITRTVRFISYMSTNATIGAELNSDCIGSAIGRLRRQECVFP